MRSSNTIVFEQNLRLKVRCNIFEKTISLTVKIKTIKYKYVSILTKLMYRKRLIKIRVHFCRLKNEIPKSQSTFGWQSFRGIRKMEYDPTRITYVTRKRESYAPKLFSAQTDAIGVYRIPKSGGRRDEGRTILKNICTYAATRLYGARTRVYRGT